MAISGKFFIEILHQGRSEHVSEEFAEPTEFGRQRFRTGDMCEALFTPTRVDGRLRYVIAAIDEAHIGRRQMLVEIPRPGTIRVTNTGSTNALSIADYGPLQPGEQGEYPAPVEIRFKEKVVRVDVAGGEGELHSLGYRTLAPGLRGKLHDLPPLSLGSARQSSELDDVETLGPWLEAVLEVLQSATRSEEFYAQAARAVVELGGLERAAVLLKRDERWDPVVRFPEAACDDGWTFSRRTLARVERDLTAVCETFNRNDEGGESIFGIRSVLAAPILNSDGTVIGALYADLRQSASRSRDRGISQRELMLIKLLASGVAAGLERIRHQEKAQRAELLLEQFFSPRLAREIALNPALLEAKDAEVTLLFCDIRDFSGVAEALGATATLEWIKSVLTVVSDCVLAEDGVVVDYIGDELFAMWGAPWSQPDHALRACRAGSAMLMALEELDRRWLAVVGRPTRLGIGINSGTARVGNIGSERRFKYGALGPDVNLASRIRGMTKYLKTDLIVSDSTKALLGEAFPFRRLSQVKVINVVQPVTVHQIFTTSSDEWRALTRGYERALELFERQDFLAAARSLGELFTQFPEDGPSLMLLSRAVSCLIDPNADRSPIWRLPGK